MGADGCAGQEKVKSRKRTPDRVAIATAVVRKIAPVDVAMPALQRTARTWTFTSTADPRAGNHAEYHANPHDEIE